MKYIDNATIDNIHDIKTIPHDRIMYGKSKKPINYMSQIFGYQIIRAVVYDCIVHNDIIVDAITPGCYIVQDYNTYTRPKVYKNYKALQKDFWINPESKKDVEPNYLYYSSIHKDIKKENAERFIAEQKRTLKPRQRRKKVKLKQDKNISQVYKSNDDTCILFHHKEKEILHR